VQQSAEVVHAPPVVMQPAPQARSHSLPPGMGTQGRPQQSALLAQGVPAGGGVAQSISACRQRGMPRLSCAQVSFWSTLPAQQFAFALHWIACRRQIAPAGEHEFPLSQRPTEKPGAFWQRTFAPLSGCPGPPQQSPSSWHSSPVGLQPLGG
jgi:hypothetical protein